MGHNVTGLIADKPLLWTFSERNRLHRPIALAQGLAILPLRDEDIDRFVPTPQGGQVDEFTYLSEQLMIALQEVSRDGPIMYFETEYFGGTGAQGSAVFSSGRCVLGPESAELGPINRALQLLGVKVVPPALDEFETVGLHLFRRSEDWLEQDG